MDGGRNCLTLVGVSFSMECRLWGGCRLSGWGVDDMGKNFGGAKEMNQIKMNFLTMRIVIEESLQDKLATEIARKKQKIFTQIPT